jgi:biopolymer transport protein ExbD
VSKRRLQPSVVINFIPLIDVLLLIIIFFMVSTTFKMASAMKLDLPTSSTTSDVKSSVLKIIVTKDSDISVDNTKTTIEALPSLIKQRVGSGDASSLSAIVEGDKEASYQLMVSVLDALRNNGIDSVGLRAKAAQKP